MRSRANIRLWSILTRFRLGQADWSSQDVKSDERLFLVERRIPKHRTGFVGRGC